ncbi:MAG: ABC transporter permease [Stellaceae bacterium]
MNADMLLDLFAAALRIATPLMWAALGGIISERAGVFAIGLEGMMLAGAFGAAVATLLSGIPFLGVLAASACGAAMGLAIAVVTVRYGADNIVTGLSANILAIGLTSFLVRAIIGHGAAPRLHLNVLQPIDVPLLASIPKVGPILFSQPPITYVALLALIPLSLLLNRTQVGLTIRATGESPMTVFAIGRNPAAIRQWCVVACGAIAGIGGSVLVLQQVGTFTDNMVAGRGYLALASIIVGRWKPFATVGACLIFGAAEALYLRVEILGVPISSYYMQMLPYLIAIVVLVTLGRSARLPAAIGTIFQREGH